MKRMVDCDWKENAIVSGQLMSRATGAFSSGLKTATPLMLITMITTKEKKMVMHNPPHPGEVIKELCIEPLGLTVTEAAKGLGVSRKTLSALLNGRFGISPEMAIRLSKAFGGSPKSWLIQQNQYDLWQVMQKKGKIKVQGVCLMSSGLKKQHGWFHLWPVWNFSSARLFQTACSKFKYWNDILYFSRLWKFM